MEKKIYSENEKHCTKRDLIEALKHVKDDDLILISNWNDFFTIKEIVHDGDGDVIMRMSNKAY